MTTQVLSQAFNKATYSCTNGSSLALTKASKLAVKARTMYIIINYEYLVKVSIPNFL